MTEETFRGFVAISLAYRFGTTAAYLKVLQQSRRARFGSRPGKGDAIVTVSLLEHSSCKLAAGALVVLVSVVAQPALAANQRASTESIPISGGFLDEHLLPLVRSSKRLLEERISAARQRIETRDLVAASKEVSAARDSAGAIRSLMPFVVAAEQLEDAKNALRTGQLSRFRRDLMRIYARLDEMSTFAPDVAARAKRRLMDAESNADMWNIGEASMLLDETRNDVLGSAAYIPVVGVYTELAAAQSALSAEKPDFAAADNAVRNADELLSIVVTSAQERRPG